MINRLEVSKGNGLARADLNCLEQAEKRMTKFPNTYIDEKRACKRKSTANFKFGHNKIISHTEIFTFILNFRYYPFIMMTSSFFLFLTVLIYTAVPTLLNPYTRIVRHYSVNLMLAFIILAATYLKEDALLNHYRGTCSMIGEDMLN